ncbi:hypothetical protein [Bacillus sp. FJAT-44742]|uniref:hypothetical protein n=1 Tax=Bacillus sp. FJAT-44742 TaxID=2014005 RepID=UPI000C232CDA|nr:hypothetical protein [Bacillus sp. FJAT-44742]
MKLRLWQKIALAVIVLAVVLSFVGILNVPSNIIAWSAVVFTFILFIAEILKKKQKEKKEETNNPMKTDN